MFIGQGHWKHAAEVVGATSSESFSSSDNYETWNGSVRY